jgi:hypothetical protein
MKFNWGHGILIFIMLFLSLCAAFIIFALNQKHDLVTDDYYEQGAHYSNQIDINNRSDVYKDSVVVNVSEKTVDLLFAKSLVASVDSVSVFFFRPSDKQNDLKVLKKAADVVSIDRTKLLPGRYILKLSWKLNNNVFMVDKDLFLN